MKPFFSLSFFLVFYATPFFRVSILIEICPDNQAKVVKNVSPKHLFKRFDQLFSFSLHKACTQAAATLCYCVHYKPRSHQLHHLQ